MNFNGLSGMSDLFRTSNAKTRSISPENFTGEPGKGGRCKLEDGIAREAARDLGTGWKVSPYIRIAPGETFEIASIQGSGCIQHIWLTPTGKWRDTILRMYWDGQEQPSVQSPHRRLLRLRLERVRPGLLSGGLRQPRQRIQLLLAHAVPQKRPDDPGKPQR